MQRVQQTCGVWLNNFSFLFLMLSTTRSKLFRYRRMCLRVWVNAHRALSISHLIIINQLILLIFYAEFEETCQGSIGTLCIYTQCTHDAMSTVRNALCASILFVRLTFGAVQTLAVIIFNPFESKECQLGTDGNGRLNVFDCERALLSCVHFDFPFPFT